MRFAYGVTIASLFGLAVLTVGVFDDAHWEAPAVLFWLVVIGASLCAVSAVALGMLAHRLGELELGVVSAFFFAASILPLVHGLTVPGVWFDPNSVTVTSVFLSIPVAALSGAVVAHGPGRWRVRLVGVATVTIGLAVALLMNPDLRWFAEPGSFAGIVFALGAFGLTIGFGWRHVRLAEIAERPEPLVVGFGYLLLGASALVFLGASTWSTYFWIAHLVDITGVFLATIGAIVAYRRHGSISQVLAPVTVIAPRQAFAIGLTPVVHRFVADLEAKDRVTRDHVVRTGALAVDVAVALGLSTDEIRQCGLVGLLHDVGKLEVPDQILQKPGRLTDDEFALMRSHARIGGDLVAATPVLADLRAAVRGHHERIDGGGYPDLLAGTDIPVVARVVAACDGFDAMSYTRHYRQGMGPEEVREILRTHAGTQWDPVVVDALLGVVARRDASATWALDAAGRDAPPVTDESGARIGCDCVPAYAAD